MHWNPQWHTPPPPPPPPPPPIQDFTLGAILSNLNVNLAGLRRDIQLLPEQIAAALRPEPSVLAVAPGRPGMVAHLKRALDLLRALSPYVTLIIVAFAKFWSPETLPLIRRLLLGID
jgi:hypothetical protein